MLTLISAWRCQGGIVMHADSQETVGDYRVSVQKIEPRVLGNVQTIVAGSGLGALIDSFIVVLQRSSSGKIFNSLAEFVTFVESQLANFYRSDVQLHPSADDEKSIKFIIAAVHPSGEYAAWYSQNVRLCRIEKLEFAGWEEPLYRSIALRLQGGSLTIAQGLMAGIYVLTVAEETSNYVRGPLNAAVIRDNGIWMEDEEHLRIMQHRLSAYEKRLNEVFLSCADTSIPAFKLEESLLEFAREAATLHREQIDSELSALTLEDVMGMNTPYPKFPPGSIVSFGIHGLQIEHDPEVIRQKVRDFKEKIQEGMALERRLEAAKLKAKNSNLPSAL